MLIADPSQASKVETAINIYVLCCYSSFGSHAPWLVRQPCASFFACTRQRHRRTYHMTMFGKEDLEGEVGIRIGGLRDAERAWDRTFTGTGHSQDLLPLELRHQPPSCLEINAKGLDEFLGNGHALLATGGHE